MGRSIGRLQEKVSAMLLMTWNVNGRVKKLEKQVEAIAGLGCDLVALQEVTIKTAAVFRDKLGESGLANGTDSFELARDVGELTGERKLGELIASRWPIRTLAPDKFKVTWQERVLSVVADTPLGEIELHTTHIPCGRTHGWRKIQTLNGIYKRLDRRTAIPRVLCGDFNTPKQETAEGRVITWGKEGSSWDRGERNVLQGLRDCDLSDVYRYQHGYCRSDFSWYPRPHIGRRFDHVFASRVLLLRGVNCCTPVNLKI
jgi:endonuclease/exonuclease/phosphatase family metal-dependent hydrolase